ncbi:T-complex protein 1 subunit epsilon [Babesia sp. Xinjiang]|uniref:T-complex protein 1 subunit epsilon n=1 Tax=Babesia sp. Xinjiang TaxID=462227 RepID=UPI000A256B41|nr:T-complex protein 1 subunit epsilon [Babesia sp. Xinjiang]ORM40637.1 T-complex protein 1 subunit epsilon [Babesia sp. Xinjiang]
MNVAVDEFGKPFVILRQQEKKRLTGLEAHKANIMAAKAVADTLRSSLGPRGMDKIIVSPDGKVTVTNDGATILQKMEVEHQCAKLLVDLSKSQDEEIGDGTTGVVILAGALLERALRLLDRGLHPLRIADGYDKACDIAIKRLEEIAANQDEKYRPGTANNMELYKKAAFTALGSKVVSSCQEHLADIAVNAVLSVMDEERKDVNLELIKVEAKTGGRLEDTCLVKGIVLTKEFSHSQMQKTVTDARIAILSCPFEPPKSKTKSRIEIGTVEDYEKLQECEKVYFENMVKRVVDSKANVVICQWGFDDEANHLLMKHGISAVRWVGGAELELVAIATGGKIVGRFEDLDESKLGRAGVVREVASGTDHQEFIFIEQCQKTKSVTVLISGGNGVYVEETKRCVHDAICCVRNLVRDGRVLGGGGAPEIAASIAIKAAAANFNTLEQFAVQTFSEALLEIPMALADNSGLNVFDMVARATQMQRTNCHAGIDCLKGTVGDMREQGIFESLHSKVQQLSLATQVVKMILKIDDVICPTEIQ